MPVAFADTNTNGPCGSTVVAVEFHSQPMAAAPLVYMMGPDDLEGGRGSVDLEYSPGNESQQVVLISQHLTEADPYRTAFQQAHNFLPAPVAGNYDGTFNYFDPDNYIALFAMVSSMDTYLQDMAREVIEHTGSFQASDGQLPHHLNGAHPTFKSLIGSVQPGPNIFWTMAAIQYAKLSLNNEWLASYMPKLRLAMEFLLQRLDPAKDLFQYPGPLMIDVFIREGYTSDTNAMMVGALREFAGAEAAVGNTTGSETLLLIAGRVSAAMTLLWNYTTSDHYITSLTSGTGNRTEDMVDYDGNIIAVAHGIPSLSQSRRILDRIDRGHCTHARGTWVSEVWYGPTHTYEGSLGDSATTMGRIGWFDALARQRMRTQQDLAVFDDVLVDPLVFDKFITTQYFGPCKNFRYGCQGEQQINRSWGYFEYPAVSAMMLSQVLDLRLLATVPSLLSAMIHTSFTYAIGNTRLHYSAHHVNFSIVGRTSTPSTPPKHTVYTYKVNMDPGTPDCR
eukprot:gene9522-247_t